MFYLIKLLSKIIFSMVGVIALTLFTVKCLAYINAIPHEKGWNDNKYCYFVTYIPDYKPYGAMGRILNMSSNQSFFVVYNKSGEKLRSSAWYFWEYQFSDLVAPEWAGIHFIYPTARGWSGWTLHECAK